MFVDFTNHPSSGWSLAQLEAAKGWGEIVDLPFPDVPANSTEADISRFAGEYLERILELSPDAVLVQGETSLSFAVAARLIKNGIAALCAASERVCETTIAEDGSTVRKSVFKFSRFRMYSL